VCGVAIAKVFEEVSTYKSQKARMELENEIMEKTAETFETTYTESIFSLLFEHCRYSHHNTWIKN
jgi:hypothetical protein